MTSLELRNISKGFKSGKVLDDVSLSVKAMELADEKEAIAQFGSSDSGASLGDILGAALKDKK